MTNDVAIIGVAETIRTAWTDQATGEQNFRWRVIDDDVVPGVSGTGVENGNRPVGLNITPRNAALSNAKKSLAVRSIQNGELSLLQTACGGVFICQRMRPAADTPLLKCAKPTHLVLMGMRDDRNIG